MTTVLLAIGLVFVIEGLALALAPKRIEDLLAIFAAMRQDQRRVLGLASVTFGVVVVAVARWISA